MKLSLYLHNDLMFFKMPSASIEKVIAFLLKQLCSTYLKGMCKESLVEDFMKREKKASTALGRGVAIPHLRVNSLDKLYVVFGRSKKGIDWQSIDGRKVHFVFLIIGPDKLEKEYLILLAQISRIVMRKNLKNILMNSNNIDEIKEAIKDSKLRHKRRHIER